MSAEPLTRLDWTALDGSLTGRVLRPGDPDYEWTRKPFIARFDDLEPESVVLCATPEDAATAVAFARRHGVEFAVRSGGHCFAGYSSTHGMVISVGDLDEVHVDGTRATVGAGMHIGDLTRALLPAGVVVPSGSCPTVGIGGTTLGGGIGVLGRLHGLTLDRLVAADVVLADGRHVTADHEREPDLFWALRGAGSGNFGVVTALTFETIPAPRMTNFYVVWDFADAAEVLKVWQHWSTEVPEEMTAGLGWTVMGETDAPAVAELFGAMVGTEADATALIDQLVVRTGRAPASVVCREMSYRETCLYQAGLLSAVNNEVLETPKGRVDRQGCRFTKGEFFTRPIPDEAIERLAAVFTADRSPGEVRGLELAPFGGGYARPGPADTAYIHRDVTFSLKHASMVPPGARHGNQESAYRWATTSWETVHPWGSHRTYPNFPDPDLADWGSYYYGEHFPRLREIKARYDPDNVFRFEQSIPVG